MHSLLKSRRNRDPRKLITPWMQFCNFSSNHFHDDLIGTPALLSPLSSLSREQSWGQLWMLSHPYSLLFSNFLASFLLHSYAFIEGCFKFLWVKNLAPLLDWSIQHCWTLSPLPPFPGFRLVITSLLWNVCCKVMLKVTFKKSLSWLSVIRMAPIICCNNLLRSSHVGIA